MEEGSAKGIVPVALIHQLVAVTASDGLKLQQNNEINWCK
jgi:hypothetical protein